MNIKRMAREYALKMWPCLEGKADAEIEVWLSKFDCNAIAFTAGAQAVLDAARGMAHDSYVARPNGPNGMDMMDVKIVLLSDLEAKFKEEVK